MTRETTKRLLDLVDDGVLDARTMVRDLLGYLSEDDVRDFAQRNDLLPPDDETGEDVEPDYDNDGMTDAEADADTLRMCGFGTDEDYGCFSGDEF